MQFRVTQYVLENSIRVAGEKDIPQSLGELPFANNADQQPQHKGNTGIAHIMFGQGEDLAYESIPFGSWEGSGLQL